MQLRTSGVRVVSQSQWMDQYQTYGFNAHAYADQVATRSPNDFCAMKKIGIVVSVASRLLLARSTHAEA